MTSPLRIAVSLIAATVLAVVLGGCSVQAPSGGASSGPSGGSSGASSSAAVKGTEPLVLVVVGFAGDENGENAVPYRDDFDWHAMAFESDKGVPAFYRDQSFGLFTWTPAHETSAFGVDGNTCTSDAKDDGVVHVVLPRGHGHWFAPQQEDGQHGTSGDAAIEAQAAIDRDFEQTTVTALREAAKHIDFASYDANGNGAIDRDELGVAVAYAGYDVNSIWIDMLDDQEFPRMQSHAFSAIDVGDNRGPNFIPDSGVIMGEHELRVPTSRLEDKQVDMSVVEFAPCSVSSLAHELGHFLKLPDYYDTTLDESAPWRYWSAGSLSAMDYGGVLRVPTGDDSYEVTTAGFDPFSRGKLGWLQPQLVSSSGTYEVRADGAPGGKNVLRVETGREGEYFLIENRQAKGYDAALKGQYGEEQVGGIVVWHVDEGIYDAYLEADQVNLPTHRPALTVQYLMEADGPSGAGSGHTLEFAKSATPDDETAFWDSASAQKRFAELGVDSFQLWKYGEGDVADDPLAREYCGIYLTFPDESADVMHVDIAFR